MENPYPDFISGNEKWKVEHALDIVKAYASGYVANAGLHGGINVSSMLDLFINAYQGMNAIEQKIKEGNLPK